MSFLLLRRWLFCLLSLSFFLLEAMTAQATTLELKQETKNISLQSQFEMFEDVSGKRSLQELMQPTLQQQFVPLHGNLNAGYTHSVYWLKMNLQRADDATPRRWLIEMTPAMLDDIRLYQTVTHGEPYIHLAGDHIAFNRQEIRHHYPLLQIYLDDTQVHTLYFRLQTTSALFFRANLFNETSFTEESNFLSGLMGIYYGIMLAIIVYNGLLMMSDGDVAMYLARDWPWLVDILPAVTPQLIVLSSSMFMCSFLKLKSRTPKANLVFRLLQACSVVMVTCMLAGYQPQVATIAQLLGLIQLSLYVPVSLLVARRGYAPGYIVLLASAVWLSGTVLIPLRNLGVLDSNWLTDFGFQI